MLSSRSVEILLLLTNGGLRFSDIVYTLDVNPKVASASLDELIFVGLVRKGDGKYYLTGRGLRAATIVRNAYDRVFSVSP